MYDNLKKIADAAPPPADEMLRLAKALTAMVEAAKGVGTVDEVLRKTILPNLRRGGSFGAIAGGPLGFLLNPGHRLEGFGRGAVRGAGAGAGMNAGLMTSSLLANLFPKAKLLQALKQPAGKAVSGIGGALTGGSGADYILNTFVGKPTWSRDTK